MSSTFESATQKLVDEHKIPSVILLATNANGDFNYHRILSPSSPTPGVPPLTEDSYLWAASCTKLLTSISVMKLVDEGRIALDDTVDAILPELAELRIITKAGPAPKYISPSNKITYRHLLTHTAGLGYYFTHPLLLEWHSENPSHLQSDYVPQRFGLPLVYEPATAWLYSSALDWAGLAVERVAGVTLSEFMAKNILNPLDIEKHDITFAPLEVPEARFAIVAERTEGGSLVAGTEGVQNPAPEHCHGGQGAFIRGPAYLKVLRSLLADDEKLLKRSTAAEMLTPQLNAAQKQAMNDYVFSAQTAASRYIEQGKADHCLCGIVDVEGRPGLRGKGTVMWGGAPNLNWFLDRDTGLCGILEIQLKPYGDATVAELTKDFEKAMYELVGKTS